MSPLDVEFRVWCALQLCVLSRYGHMMGACVRCGRCRVKAMWGLGIRS